MKKIEEFQKLLMQIGRDMRADAVGAEFNQVAITAETDHQKEQFLAFADICSKIGGYAHAVDQHGDVLFKQSLIVPA